MRRREFIAFLGGGLLALPLAAQQSERVRRIGVVMTIAASDPQARACAAAFREALKIATFAKRLL